MSRTEEELPLSGNHKKAEHRDQRLALGLAAFALLACAVSSFPPVARQWHPIYYPSLEMEQRGWAWLSTNSIWMAIPLIWTLFYIENTPCVQLLCLLGVVSWAYAGLVFISQAIRGQLPWTSVFDAVAIAVLFLLSLKASWGFGPSEIPGSNYRRTWKHMLRKCVLIAACLQLFGSFVACWLPGLPAAPKSGRESAPWEWNSVVILAMTLTVLWAAFVSSGEFVDVTKQAACAWCALFFAGNFFLAAFSWPALGLVGCSLTISIILALDVSFMIVAAVV
ncbi:unnamed protein product [Ascophyllum nodosum]